MRKITEEAVSAFMNNEPFNKSNTSVRLSQNAEGKQVTQMFLHGNQIASKVNGHIMISNAGWESNTTKERLNGLLDRLGYDRIYQKDFVWYQGGRKFPYDIFVAPL